MNNIRCGKRILNYKYVWHIKWWNVFDMHHAWCCDHQPEQSSCYCYVIDLLFFHFWFWFNHQRRPRIVWWCITWISTHNFRGAGIIFENNITYGIKLIQSVAKHENLYQTEHCLFPTIQVQAHTIFSTPKHMLFSKWNHKMFEEKQRFKNWQNTWKMIYNKHA